MATTILDKYKAVQSDLVSEFVEDRYNGLIDELEGLRIPVASGSSAAGSWVKYADGTMEAWGSTTFGAACDAGDNGAYVSDDISLSFPETFAAAPSVTLSTYATGSTRASCFPALRGVSASAFVFKMLAWTAMGYSGFRACWHAIGTWSA